MGLSSTRTSRATRLAPTAAGQSRLDQSQGTLAAPLSDSPGGRRHVAPRVDRPVGGPARAQGRRRARRGTGQDDLAADQHGQHDQVVPDVGEVSALQRDGQAEQKPAMAKPVAANPMARARAGDRHMANAPARSTAPMIASAIRRRRLEHAVATVDVAEQMHG